MHHNILTDLPSIPQIPSSAPLHIGITTRVMAKRQSIQKERNEQEVDQHRRRSSQFLTGTRVPNSTIKLEFLNRDNAQTRSEITRKERNEFFEKLMKQLRLRESHSIASLIDTNMVQVSSGPITQETRELITKETESKPILESSSKNKGESTSAKRDLRSAFKRQRRISFRTSTLDLRNGEKRPTYESVQTTIQNSAIIQKVLNVDYDGEQQLKKAHLRVSQQEPVTSKLKEVSDQIVVPMHKREEN